MRSLFLDYYRVIRLRRVITRCFTKEEVNRMTVKTIIDITTNAYFLEELERLNGLSKRSIKMNIRASPAFQI